MQSRIREFETCCWDLRGVLSRLGPDEVCCEGLTPRQCRVLRAVGQEPKIDLTSLARAEGLTLSGMSRRVIPLVDGGWLEKERGNREDRRALKLELTKKGRESLAQVEDTIYGGIETLWQAMNPGERGKVLDALKVLVRAARRVEKKSPARRAIPLRAR
jgi:DNA-binding MarR family transcriptional regulator